MENKMEAIICSNVNKSYGKKEVLKNNVEEIKEKNIKFLNPFLPFDAKNLAKTILELPEFKEYNFTKKELIQAAKKAEKEYIF